MYFSTVVDSLGELVMFQPLAWMPQDLLALGDDKNHPGASLYPQSA